MIRSRRHFRRFEGYSVNSKIRVWLIKVQWRCEDGTVGEPYVIQEVFEDLKSAERYQDKIDAWTEVNNHKIWKADSEIIPLSV